MVIWSGVRAYFEELKEIRPDALDYFGSGCFYRSPEKFVRRLSVHISTQANNTNYGTYQFWHKLGAQACGNCQRAFYGRASGRSGPIFRHDLEIETFIHGAMCISYSGRCLLSNYPGWKRCQSGVPAHIRAAGNIPLWKSPDRESICRFMKMSVVLTFSIPRIFA